MSTLLHSPASSSLLEGCYARGLGLTALSVNKPFDSRPGAALRHCVVSGDHDHRAEQGHEEARWLSLSVPAKRTPEKAAQERPEHAEDHRDDPPSGVLTVNDEAREGADDQAEQQKKQDAHW